MLELLNQASEWSVGIMATVMAVALMSFFVNYIFHRGPISNLIAPPQSFRNIHPDLYHDLSHVMDDENIDPKTQLHILHVIDRHGGRDGSVRIRVDGDYPDPIRDHKRQAAEKALAVIAAVGGVAGMLLTLFNWPDLLKLLWNKVSEWVVPSAYAQAPPPTPPRVDISFLTPYFLVTVVAIMGISFVAAVIVALMVPTKKGNAGRRKTANEIIKMAGSFFVGFGMALIK